MDKKGKIGKFLAKVKQRESKGTARGQRDRLRTLMVAIRAVSSTSPGEEKEATPA